MTELIVEISENKYMLRLGDNDDKSDLTIQDVSGKIEDFDIFLNIKNQNDVERLKKIFHAEGGSVKEFAWYFYSEYEISAADVVEMLNCFTKVETLKLSSFRVKFIGDCCKKIILPNIKCLNVTSCDNFIIDFLTNVLPENSLPGLIINEVKDIEDKLHDFIKKQSSIKQLTLCEDLKTIEPFKLLFLESLCCPIRHDDEKIEKQQKFINSLIKSQKKLKSLDLLCESDQMFSFVNDEIFADICALSKLENLSINIENLTQKGIQAFSNLTALKTFKMKASFESLTKLKMLKEFSAIKNSSIENLTLDTWFEIPYKIIVAIGQNYQNLKSLTITNGINECFSLFAKSLSNLESLNITLGDYNPLVTFDEVYDENDDVTLPKLKNLMICIYGDINPKLFFKFLSNFPKLEKLDIHAELPFTADFLNQFANNLNKIKHVKFYFDIKNGETFPIEVSNALKLLCSKLNYIYIFLRNRQKSNMENVNFTYEPLIDELIGIYRIKESYFKHVYVDKKMIMEAGKEE